MVVALDMGGTRVEEGRPVRRHCNASELEACVDDLPCIMNP